MTLFHGTLTHRANRHGVVLISQAAVPRQVLGQILPGVRLHMDCAGKYKGRLKPSAAELKDISGKNAEWLKDGGPNNPKLANDPRRANLCDADLRGAYLYGANLEYADLTVADLSGANLSSADLRSADLEGATLRGAILDGANLHGANLQGVHLDGETLTKADFSGADLLDANLSGSDLSGVHLDGTGLEHADLTNAHLIGAYLNGADLTNAHLNGADLRSAEVTKAHLGHADLTGAIYAPVSEPPDPYVAGIKGLATLNAASGEQIGLIQPRKLLQDAGLGENVSEVTCSIQRAITADDQSSSQLWILGVLRTVGFDWTTAYGLYPQRALRGMLLLGAVLTPVYMFAMLRPTAASGVIQIFPKDRLEGTAGDPADEEKRKKQLVHAKGWRAALQTAAYFSLISAINIGFEQFTPGDWIRRLQTRDYSLEAVGWVRVVAGAQALLSVYLLAMWVLTQFGRPFE